MTDEQTQPTETQTKANDWLQTEKEELDKQANFDGERLPALKFEENKIVEFEVDFSEPFKEYNDAANNSLKKIIPVTHNTEKKILWLNVKNPLYSELIRAGAEGQTNFKVMQIGNQANTKYNLVRD